MACILDKKKKKRLGSSFLPVCGACCISPPGGRIPLRLRLGPNMGLAPLINVWGLLQTKEQKGKDHQEKQPENTESLHRFSHFSSYQTDLTTLMKLRPAGLAMTCDEVVPVVIDVPIVGRGMVMTGSGWLRASCCGAKGARRAGWDWPWTIGGSEGVGVTERGADSGSVGWGVEHGVLVGVGVDGFGVPDPELRETAVS